VVIDSRENVSSQMKATERDIQPLPADIDRSLSLSETLGDIYDKMPTQDKIALLTAPIPIVGDIAGGVADVMAIKEDPSATNIGLALAGLLPFVPSGGVTKAGLKAAASQALPQIPNTLKYFYSGNPVAKAYGVTEGGTKGLANIIEARYSPKARALFKEEGISVADKKAANKALKEFQNPDTKIIEKQKKDGPSPAKKAIGQGRQSILFAEQYDNPSKFRKMTEGIDEIAFGNFNINDYTKILKGSTGLNKKDFDSVFNEIKKVQNVNPNKNYRMTVRRTNTQAAGNLDNAVFKNKIFGGSSLTGLKKNVFKGKKFTGKKSNENFLEALEKNNIKVRNPKEVLKGRPAIVSGSVKSDAVELGGVNYMTAIKKDGTGVSFMNDENDLFRFKAPLADRMISISTPISIDFLKKKDSVKRVSKGLVKSEETLKQAKNKKMLKVETDLLKKYPKLIDTKLKTPQGMTKAQFYTLQVVSKIEPSNLDYSRLLKEVGLAAPLRASKPLAREEENRKRGGSVIERNPYNYQPRAI
tara:strand:+ start:104 stop:1690 length:1587 start_codon:yes stop_codon:yes gene_type:complete